MGGVNYTLVNVDHEENGFVSGNWIQDFAGTLEEATQMARETERVNNNRITVAVVENMYFSQFQRIYKAKRLDKQKEL